MALIVDEEKEKCDIFVIIYIIKTFIRFRSIITLLRSPIRCLFDLSSAMRLFLFLMLHF